MPEVAGLPLQVVSALRGAERPLPRAVHLGEPQAGLAVSAIAGHAVVVGGALEVLRPSSAGLEEAGATSR